MEKMKYLDAIMYNGVILTGCAKCEVKFECKNGFSEDAADCENFDWRPYLSHSVGKKVKKLVDEEDEDEALPLSA